MGNERIVLCETCQSEGRILRGAEPEPTDNGPCPVCDGTGEEIIETQPVELDDLDQPEITG